MRQLGEELGQPADFNASLKPRTPWCVMVNDLSRLSSVNGNAHPHRPDDDTAAQIRAIAELAAHLLDGAGCLIAWQGVRTAATIRAASAAHLNAGLDSVLAVIERDRRDRGDRANASGGVLRFSNDELAAASGKRARDRAYVTAAMSISSTEGPTACVTAILIAPSASATCALDGAVELVARSTINLLHTTAAMASRDFWREQAADSGARLAVSKAKVSRHAAARDLIEGAVTAAEKLRPRDRFKGLGALFAKLVRSTAGYLPLPRRAFCDCQLLREGSQRSRCLMRRMRRLVR